MISNEVTDSWVPVCPAHWESLELKQVPIRIKLEHWVCRISLGFKPVVAAGGDKRLWQTDRSCWAPALLGRCFWGFAFWSFLLMTVCAIRWVSCPQMNLSQFLHSAKWVYFEDRASTGAPLGGKQLASTFSSGTQTVCAHNVLFQLLAGGFMLRGFLKYRIFLLSAGH